MDDYPASAIPPASMAPATGPEQERIHFDALQARALDVVQRLAAHTWTDHEDHDPGITILQALAYGVSDLAYRHTLPLRDLLTGEDSGPSLFPDSFGPHQALTCSPVTEDDYRRAILDLHSSDAVDVTDAVDGAGNGYFYFRNVRLIPESPSQQLAYFYNPQARTFSYEKEEEGAQRFQLAGAYRLYLEPADGADRAAAETAINRFLVNNRNLCETVRSITWLAPTPGHIDIAIELADDANDPARILAQVFLAARDLLLSPAARQSAAGLAAQGLPFEEIYQGPRLRHGWITRLPPARDHTQPYQINASLLVNRILGIEGVASLAQLNIAGTASHDPTEDTAENTAENAAAAGPAARWVFTIPAGRYLQLWNRSQGRSRRAAADWVATFLGCVTLARRGQQIEVSAAAFMAALQQREPAPITEAPVTLPAGRLRNTGQHYPVSRLLPPAYGLAQRQPSIAETQLHQFLLPLEQLLANACAQLAALPRLLSFDRGGDTRVWGRQWPFGQDDPIDRVAQGVHAPYAQGLLDLNHASARDAARELAIIGWLQATSASISAPISCPRRLRRQRHPGRTPRGRTLTWNCSAPTCASAANCITRAPTCASTGCRPCSAASPRGWALAWNCSIPMRRSIWPNCRSISSSTAP